MYQLMLSKSNECQKITNLDNFCCFIKQTYPTQFIGFSSIDNAGDDDDDDEDGADDDRGDDVATNSIANCVMARTDISVSQIVYKPRECNNISIFCL